MDVYVYAADLYCETCGEAIREEIDAAGKGPDDPSVEYSYDSDDYPKGPYPHGGGESDSPRHCGSGPECACPVILMDGRKVGAFLENPLTSDGVEYVREAVSEALGRGQRGKGTSVALEVWAPFYDLDIDPPTVYLDNMEERDGCVVATVHAPGALAWARDDQSIAGSNWEGVEREDPDFAYATPADYPGLVSDLRSEGYGLNLDEYSPPED